ncbi:kinase-like domain-containing protein [Mycena galopus ATCC 62051]|nr:kinase-like domain-containing protein [Mycena galopus ATCC 62051]
MCGPTYPDCFAEEFSTLSQPDDGQVLIDLLQTLLDHCSVSKIRMFLFKGLLRFSRDFGLYPTCFALTKWQDVELYTEASGCSSDIYKASVCGQGVSVRVIKTSGEISVSDLSKLFGHEALIWRQLDHPNVLPFVGLSYLNQRLCLVSPWMENGSLSQYLSGESPNLDRRLSLILDVALGLQYLHQNSVVHGDLRAANVLVTPSHRACIAHFCFSSMYDARFNHPGSGSREGTRWLSPELLRSPESHRDFGSDVYAFSCVCYEVLTEKLPFFELPNDSDVAGEVLHGRRPTWLNSSSTTAVLDNVQNLVRDCWNENSVERPRTVQIVQRLLGPSVQATATCYSTDWDENLMSRSRRSLHAQPLRSSITQIERQLVDELCGSS